MLDLPASEVAEALDTTVAAVKCGLQRARSSARRASRRTTSSSRAIPIVERYVAAFERADVAALRALLTPGVVVAPADMRGRDWRALRVAAKGQLAFAAYSGPACARWVRRGVLERGSASPGRAGAGRCEPGT